MKQIFTLFSVAAVMVACNSNPKTGVDAYVVGAPEQKPAAVVVDTFGLSEFQQWKAQNELAEANTYQQATAAALVAPEAKPVKRSTAARKTTSKSSTASAKSRSVSNSNAGSADSEAAHTAKAPEKKGWSKAAKGTAIGAGSGAVVGAVINKRNRAIGGVVGGVVGGAVGYGIGRGMDKKMAVINSATYIK